MIAIAAQAGDAFCGAIQRYWAGIHVDKALAGDAGHTRAALLPTCLEPAKNGRRQPAGTIRQHFHRSYLQEVDKVDYEAYQALEACNLDALIAACNAREHDHGALACDYMGRLLRALFGEDVLG